MKLSRLLFLIVPLLLTACGLSDQEKADYSAVQRSNVSSATYDKMVHDDALSLSDVKGLSRAGVNQGVILRYLRNHQTIYTLSSGDVQDLKNAGVSASVIDYMLQTARGYPYGGPDLSIGLGYGPGWYGPGPGWYGPGWHGGYYHRGYWH